MKGECGKALLEHFVELLSNLQTVIDEMERVVDVEAREICFRQEDIPITHKSSPDFDAHEFGFVFGEFHLQTKKRYRGRKSNRWSKKKRIGYGAVHVPMRRG